MRPQIDFIAPEHLDRVAEISAFGSAPDGLRTRILAVRAERFRMLLSGEGHPFQSVVGYVISDEDGEPGYPLGYALVARHGRIGGRRGAPGVAYILDLCVDGHYRRRGLGDALVGAILDHHLAQYGWWGYAVVPEDRIDVQCLFRSVARSRNYDMVVLSGTHYDPKAHDAGVDMGLSRLGADREDRYLFSFRPPRRVAIERPSWGRANRRRSA
jgi:ribosomal protein S18 acetylase RimI-like enzyme